MIVPIYDRSGRNYDRTPETCSVCRKPASYAQIPDTTDRIGLADSIEGDVFYCSLHRPISSGAYVDALIARDCLDRPCGPDHCEFPTCRLGKVS